MIEWRVIVYGVTLDLKPSANPHHQFDRCFPAEDDDRTFFDACQYRAQLYSIDWMIGALGKTVVAEK